MDALRHSFPASNDSLASLLAFVERCGQELALPSALTVKLLLIVEELFTNTVRHGCGPASAAPVLLQLAHDGDEVALEFEDGGSAYNPFEHPDLAAHEAPLADRPVGRLGVLLIEGFATRVAYARVAGHNRIRVWLRCPS